MTNGNDDAQSMLSVDGSLVSLADLAGISVDQLPETRGSSFPAGAFLFKCEKAELGIFGADETKKAAVKFDLVCTDVKTLLDNSISAEAVVGRKHSEVIFIAGKQKDGNNINPMQKMGYVTTFMADTGFKGSGSFGDLLAGFQGTEFIARVKTRKNPDDPDQPYASLGIFTGFWKAAPSNGSVNVYAK